MKQPLKEKDDSQDEIEQNDDDCDTEVSSEDIGEGNENV